jgi:RNA polymerase-interacting CarD/CdnL/TRCF family regulator
MVFKIGDKVIHLNHGLGEIVEIEDKMIHDHIVSCYVFRTPHLTTWVPIDTVDRHNLRLPKSKREFKDLSSVLQSPNEPLPEDHLERKKHLLELMNDGQLNSICRVVRALSDLGNNTKLNEMDKSILERAKNSLLVEWMFSLSVTLSQAQHQMAELLDS